jgi:hypothetical protein
MTDPGPCAHPAWVNHDQHTPLCCADCGTVWPGHELPVPPGRNDGYGPLAEQAGWGERVRAMERELADVV